MATKVYETAYIQLISGKELYITPLKIKYLRDFMDKFQDTKNLSDDQETIDVLLDCAAISMRQYYPEIATKEQVSEELDIKTLYKLLDIAAGIKIDSKKEDESISKQANDSGSTWESFDLVSLESEAFLLGIWRDYEELEASLSMQELTAILTQKREMDYQNKKFMAAIQGVELNDGKKGEPDAWEKLKARVFSGGQTTDPNDITSFQGPKAAKAGFGIGMGIEYQKI